MAGKQKPLLRHRTTPWVLSLVLWAILSSCCAAVPTLTVSIIDVQQGDSILVDFPNGQHMFVDAGHAGHGDVWPRTPRRFWRTRTCTMSASSVGPSIIWM